MITSGVPGRCPATEPDVARLAPGRLRQALLVLAIRLATAGTAAAQDPSQEFWPEVDAWWRVSPAWRVSLFVPLSENLDTHYREGNVIPQVDFAFGQTRFERRLADEDRTRKMKAFMVRGGISAERASTMRARRTLNTAPWPSCT